MATPSTTPRWKAWSADRPGKRYQILPANYCLRAIALPAGEHHIIMEYRPLGWIIGKWVSLASLLGLLGLVLVMLRQNKRGGGGQE